MACPIKCRARLCSYQHVLFKRAHWSVSVRSADFWVKSSNSWRTAGKNGRARPLTNRRLCGVESGPSNGRPFGLKKSTAVPDNGIGTIHHSDRQPVCCCVSVGCCSISGMSVVDSILFVVAASHVADSISAWSCAIPDQRVIQWATVWSQNLDSGSG
jgi:hypothetical protein